MNLYELYFKDWVIIHKKTIIIYLFITCLSVIVADIIIPVYYSKLVSNLSEKKNKFVLLFGIIFFLWILYFILNYFKNNIDAHFMPTSSQSNRNKFLTASLNKFKNNVKDIKVGENLIRIYRVSVELHYLILDFINIIPILIGFIIVNFYLLYLNINVGLFNLLGFFILLLFVKFNYSKILNISIKNENNFYENIDLTYNKFSNLMNIYLNNQNKEEEKKIKNIQQNRANLDKNFFILKHNFNNNLLIIYIIFFVFTIFLSYYLYKKNNLSKANLISIIFILIFFMNFNLKSIELISDIIYKIGLISSSKKYLGSLFETTNKNGDINLNLNNNNDFNKFGNIKFLNVSFYYPKNNEEIIDNQFPKSYIFKNLNLEIKHGERIAIIGQSGSGKSTLMKLAMNLYNFEGDILLNNISIKKIKNNLLREKIIYINQKTLLFEDTVIENIKYGNNITNQEIIETLKKYELDKIYEGLKDGLNSNCGLGGNNLSIGMQKITIILRGYFKIKNANIVIFDEPLAGLDKYSREKVLRLIKEIPTNKTIIIITHDQEIFSITNKKIDINELKK